MYPVLYKLIYNIVILLCGFEGLTEIDAYLYERLCMLFIEYL